MTPRKRRPYPTLKCPVCGAWIDIRQWVNHELGKRHKESVRGLDWVVTV